MDNDDLKIGDRVRLTPLGEERSAGLKTTTGVIKGRTRGNGYYVLMDGNKTTSTLHRTYIEIDDRAYNVNAFQRRSDGTIKR